MTDRDTNTTTSSDVNKGYYYYDTNTKNENQNRDKIAIISIGSPQTAKGDDDVTAKAEESKGGERKQPGNRHREAKVLSPTKQPCLTFCKERRREGRPVPSS